jgi:hypothetical protein
MEVFHKVVGYSSKPCSALRPCGTRLAAGARFSLFRSISEFEKKIGFATRMIDQTLPAPISCHGLGDGDGRSKCKTSGVIFAVENGSADLLRKRRLTL